MQETEEMWGQSLRGEDPLDNSSFLEYFPSWDYQGKHPSYVCLCTFLRIVLTGVKAMSHKEANNNQDVPPELHHASVCDSKRRGGGSASEEKVQPSISHDVLCI